MGALPDWPRMLSRSMAAAYCGLTSVTLEREVAEGRLPMPVQLGGQAHWCRKALDTALDRLTMDTAPDWRKGARERMKNVA